MINMTRRRFYHAGVFPGLGITGVGAGFSIGCCNALVDPLLPTLPRQSRHQCGRPPYVDATSWALPGVDVNGAPWESATLRLALGTCKHGTSITTIVAPTSPTSPASPASPASYLPSRFVPQPELLRQSVRLATAPPKRARACIIPSSTETPTPTPPPPPPFPSHPPCGLAGAVLR
jgi:hypothetical protein